MDSNNNIKKKVLRNCQPHPGKQSTESDFKHNPKTIKVINSMIVYDSMVILSCHDVSV